PDDLARVQRRGQRHRARDTRAAVRDRGSGEEEGAGVSRIELTAGPEQDGQRLDVALAAHPAVGSRAAAQRLLDAGVVTVDGRARPKRHRLSPGERIEAEAPVAVAVDPGQAGAGVPFEVAYEDEHLLVVDKPAGVVVHPAPGHETGTLAQALAARGA